MGLSKDVSHQVLEFHSAPIPPHSTKSFYDLSRDLQIPVMPPTMSDVCKVIEIFYTLKVSIYYKVKVVKRYCLLTVNVPKSKGHLNMFNSSMSWLFYFINY